ncbi:MAG TPA: aldehyde dehydrogenase family protein [Solirubrobacterales bacterium]|nr:aldehyde dehydrogenase family protein [Solirubrobacterales bacterium]
MGQLDSFNPTTGELIAAVETVEPEDVQGIVGDVAEVQPFWRELSLADRGQYMSRVAEVLAGEADDVARLIASEQGKPITECYTMEVVPTIDGLGWIADAGAEILDDEQIKMGSTLFFTKRAKFTYEPIGVVGVIAPWNYPWSIPFGEIAMALMAGNGVVLKPSELTPLLGERIRDTFERAGLPEGLIRVAQGDGEVGRALVESSARKIFFTGSVATGRKVGEACARMLKGSVLELGGKDAAIVCSDADLENAVSGIAWAGFANAGQTCSGVERVYVLEDVAEEFLSGLVRETERMRLGDPRSWDVEVGPMVSEAQYELVNELVDDALANGAERLTGGPREIEGSPGSYIAPTVLSGVKHKMRIMREEIFGPVVPVIPVANEEEAIELANDSEFGLGSSVWTRDRRKGERMARRIEAGMVWINDHAYSHGAMQCSWGGVKDSGLGRAHSKFGFYECVDIKLVTWEPGHTRNFWWQPYDETLGEAIRSAAGVLYGNGSRIRALREGGGSLIRTGARTFRKGR